MERFLELPALEYQKICSSQEVIDITGRSGTWYPVASYCVEFDLQ